jgi:5-formyltetrahydrofolate cyclo-ligase
MVKSHTRKQVSNFMKSLSKEQLQDKSRQACKKMCATPEFQQASKIMMFLSFEIEVDTSYAIEKALQDGKMVLVPAIDWENQKLIPVILPSLDCEMVYDRYDLRHPAEAKTVAVRDVELIVVPGMGFDLKGNRLGRGGGFYDRLLSHSSFRGVNCGLALEEQIIEKVPVLDHDVPLNMLVTDQAVRRFGN